MNANNPLENRVLFLAPTARDGRITQKLLANEKLDCQIHTSVLSLGDDIRRGVALVLITDDALASPGIDDLISALAEQPAWSDIPVVIFMRREVEPNGAARALRALTNVTQIERPAPMQSILSAVKAALRGRQRQYQLRIILEREQSARSELEVAGRMKDEFLATLSHELRTPLNAILGWSQLIRAAGMDSGTVEEGLSVIERNARIQVQLIEDLLDMSRIISGKIRLEMKTLLSTSFVDAAIETVSPTAEAKGLRLERSYESDAGQISGDAGRLQQVVWNLLSNAIKFTPAGGTVRVTVRRENASVVISVSDSGAGIKADFLPHVFERFRQADASTTRSYGGLGLGLAIVKNLVDLQGGTITASSPGEGQGSTFTVTLPAAPLHRGPAIGASSIDAHRPRDRESIVLDGVRVLVVDDEADARRLVKRLLEDRGASVVTAASASEALRCFEVDPPGLVISDIGMPIADGYELLRKIRVIESLRGTRTPAIAITAFARSEDRARALLAGYSIHLAKPIEPDELLIAAAGLLGRLAPLSEAT